MKKILFLAAIAAMMTVACTKEQTPATNNPGGQQTPGGDEGGSGDEGEGGGGSQRVLTGLRSAYTYYVADEALNISVIGKPKKVVAVYSDNTTESASADAVTFAANAQIAAQNGNQSFSVTYNGQTTQMVIPVVKGSEGFGATSLDGAWTFASENTVGQLEVGQSATLKMFVYSAGQNNYSAPIAELVSADWNNVYADFRMDHFGWLNADIDNQKLADSYKSSNWDWDTFAASQNHALINITVSHSTATTATVRYDVTYWNGESHFQEYTNVPVGGTPVNYRFATESSYAVVYEISKPEGGGEQGGGDEPQPGDKTLTGYRAAYNYYVADEALSLDVVGYPKKLVAVYSDNSTAAVDASAFTFTAGQQIAATAGVQNLSATYNGAAVSVAVNVVKGTDKGGDKSFNTTTANIFINNTVGQLSSVGESATTKMFVYSACGENWHAPVTEVCYGDWSGVFFHARMDNYGWWEKNGDIWEAGNTFNNNNRDIELKSDWNWDTFKGFQNHAAITVTVTVATETTAVVRYDVTYWNGEKHYQEFSNIGVGLPINWRFFTENSYAVVYE